jgi:hypothetical protein
LKTGSIKGKKRPFFFKNAVINDRLAAGGWLYPMADDRW